MGQKPPKELLLIGPDNTFPLANMLGQNLAVKVNTLDASPLFSEGVSGGDTLIQSFAAVSAALREMSS